MTAITQILSAVEQGDSHAANELLPLVYDELRQLAAAKLAREKPGQTLQPTALVHEAYLRLVTPSKSPPSQGGGTPASSPPFKGGDTEGVRWHSRAHFFAAAAEAMRRILVENARRKQSLKKGGRRRRIHLKDFAVSPQRDDDLLALDEALSELAKVDSQASELVKLRFFAGLTVPQAAESLGVSPRTADFLWAYARAWLLRFLTKRDVRL
jgi:DNA-directed RNA polymerase specialized sigma24 family protein